MGVRGKRVVPRCQAVDCQSAAKQSCLLCARGCCAAHGHWVKAAQIGSLRGPTPLDSSVWLCTLCATSTPVATPPAPRLNRRRVVIAPASGVAVPVD